MTTTTDQRTNRRFEHDGVGLVYDDLGDRAAPAVVLIHGGTMSRETWDRLASHLSGEHRVLAVDLAGHGDSDRAPGAYAVPDQGQRVAAFCEHVAGGGVVLVGHSFGGLVAAHVSATRPDLVRATVLEDPPMYLFDPEVWPTTMFSILFPMLRAAMIDAAATEDPAGSIRSWLLGLPPLGDRGTQADILGPDGVERFARAWSSCDPHLLDGIDDIANIHVSTWGDHDIDTPIHCRVLVLRADPQLLPAFLPEHEQRFRRIAPRAAFAVARGSGHNIHDERPDWFTTQVTTFLADARGTGPHS